MFTCPHCRKALEVQVKMPPLWGDWPDSIEALGMSVRTRNCLYRAGIYTIQELSNQHDKDLLAIPNFGRVCLDEVYSALGEWKTKARVI